MLRDIPGILSPDLLHSLRAMGHGDIIVIADANFPATALAQRCHRLDGIKATDVLEAVLRVMPLDSFVPDPALVMEVVDDPTAVPPIVVEFQDVITDTADTPARLGRLERFAFYERAKSAFAIVQTGETRLYGNIILKKGVIAP
ncbi:MAG: RbsD/FucU domain-containing protein [Tateyamaria sp.]|uniref:RbsD/FucU family protein n=1 Tax=Tateyamaria sp. TaxID=1929288 RepID=UPI00327EBD70